MLYNYIQLHVEPCYHLSPSIAIISPPQQLSSLPLNNPLPTGVSIPVYEHSSIFSEQTLLLVIVTVVYTE